MSTTTQDKKQRALRKAAYNGKINNVKKCLNDDTVNVNGKDNASGCTSLHVACWNGHRDVAEVLLDHRADIDAATNRNETPLNMACWNGHLPITKLLLDRGCAINAPNKDGDTALHCACWVGSTECVKELLAHGADTSIKRKGGSIPLDLAKAKKHQTVIDLFMEYKKHSEENLMDSNQDEKIIILSEVRIDTEAAVLSTKNKQQQDEGLISAVIKGRISDIKKVLNDDTVDVNVKDSSGCTALHWACWNGYRDVAELLLDNGANIEARSSINSTPVMWASWNGQTSTTRFLLDRGCVVNADNKDGYTPLHCACRNSSTECVKELLVHGADTTIKNRYGQTPFDIAKERKQQPVIDLLVEHRNGLGKYLMDSNQRDTKNSTLTEVRTLKAKDTECVASTSNEQLSSKVESIVSRHCEELHDMIAIKQEEITSNFESKIEALRSEISAANQDNKKVTSQLTISNAEIAKCVSNLGTILESVSLKVSSSQVHHDSE